MKSIIYAHLFLILICFSHASIAQPINVNDRVVITEDEFKNASQERQEEIRNNRDAFVVVKDGQKVDIWREASKPVVKDGQKVKISREGSKAKADQSGSSDYVDSGKEESVGSGIARSAELEQERADHLKAEAEQRKRESVKMVAQEPEWKMTDKEQAERDGRSIAPKKDMRPEGVSYDDDAGQTSQRQNIQQQQAEQKKPVSSDASLFGSESFTPKEKQELFGGEDALSTEEYDNLSSHEKQLYIRRQRAKNQ